MMASDCNIGDLIIVTHDCYIFIEDKAFMMPKDTSAIIVQVLTDEDELNIEEFSKGRRALWKGSIMICDEFGRTGWCHAGNVNKI
tara:strand:- start:53 stop:307 length:255 start_codon:yes stop_codon:yes gene_type:complete